MLTSTRLAHAHKLSLADLCFQAQARLSSALLGLMRLTSSKLPIFHASSRGLRVPIFHAARRGRTRRERWVCGALRYMFEDRSFTPLGGVVRNASKSSSAQASKRGLPYRPLSLSLSLSVSLALSLLSTASMKAPKSPILGTSKLPCLPCIPGTKHRH